MLDDKTALVDGWTCHSSTTSEYRVTHHLHRKPDDINKRRLIDIAMLISYKYG